MVQRVQTIPICDLCGREDNEGTGIVTTHQLVVDKHAVEAEVCDPCWDKKVLKPMALLSKNGRRVKAKRK